MKKGFFVTEVLSNKKIGDNICVLELKNVFSEMPKPGQFIMLEPLNQRSAMPRPFSVIHADSNSIFVIIKIVGKNSRLYSELEQGYKVKFSGPLGQPFFIEKNVRYLLVGGGIGIVALFQIAIKLIEEKNKFKMFFGAKTKSEVRVFRKEFFADDKHVKTIFEEGENGGTVIDLLKEELKNDGGKSIIVSCGPKGMLRAVAETAKKNGNKCLVSLEEIMACGVGSCKGCAVFGINENTAKHVCEDGPFFDAEWVDWEKYAPALSPFPLPRISKKTKYPMRIILKGQNGRKLILPSPIINASGCLSLEALESGYADISRAGALVVKGLKPKLVLGNPMPRVCEVDSGMINSIGLEGPGLFNFLEKELDRWLAFGEPVIINICGEKVDDYVYLASELSRISCIRRIAALEANISCPNIDKGGMLIGVDPNETFNTVSAIRKTAPDKFLIVKLTPNVTDISVIAKAAEKAGADAISAINTLGAMSVDVRTRRPRIAKVIGGLSGPAIKPIGVKMVHQIVQAVKIPVIAMGGIETAEDAAEYIMVGASAVAVGTGLFKNPKAITEIYDGLLEIMKLHGANHIHNLRGSLII
jgi:dihydroorotate dehydrogenase (NAD+) catalytic subunit